MCSLCCARGTDKRTTSRRRLLKQPDQAYHYGSGSSRPSSNQNSPRGEQRDKSYMENLATSFATFPARSTHREEDTTDSGAATDSGAESSARTLSALKAIAKCLEGPIQKYPRSGKGLFKKVQDRYIATIPGESRDGDETDKLQLWRKGQLAYWESADGYKKNATPKGAVTLMKIAKVAVSKDDVRGRSVIVKHKSGEDMQELVLCFPSKSDADEWSYTLWEFISKLRGDKTGNSFHRQTSPEQAQ